MAVEPLPPDVLQVATRIADARDADVYFYVGPIDGSGAARFRECVISNRKRPNALLILTTLGGSGDAAYQMARCLQDSYSGGNLAVFVATICKSAGTLLALGAKEMVMTDLAELGPLDVQITKPDTLGERTSGLTPSQSLSTLRVEAFQCFEKFFLDILESSGYAITTKTAARVAASVTSGLYRPVFAQIDPMTLGEFQRAVQIANEYGKRLDFWARNLKEKSLGRLINGYPSHEFVIDRQEAETLFKRVSLPTDDETELFALMAQEANRSIGGKHAITRYFPPPVPGPKVGGGTSGTPPTARGGNGSAGTRSSRNGRRGQSGAGPVPTRQGGDMHPDPKNP